MPADRNLLFGILAVQIDLISDSQLIAALHEWKREPKQPLGDVLVRQGAMTPGDRALVEPLVDRQLARYAQNAEASIAHLPVPASIMRGVAGSLGADSPYDPAMTVDDSSPGGRSSRYEKVSLHREGGLGQVFKAEDTELHRLIALKEIKPRHADDPARRTSFVREAEITSKLEHPGIVPIYGLGVYPDARPYYAMRFVEGRELREVIDEFHKSKKSFDSLEFRTLLDSLIAAANAVAYAHSRGVIHRDIKPANILLGPFGETLVVDWGLAKVISRPEPMDGTATVQVLSGDDTSRTVSGAVKGTLAYMAPEQAEGKVDELKASADIYSLGATLYHILAGRNPFAEKSEESIHSRVIAGAFPKPGQMRGDVPKPLEAIALRAMANAPADRYPSARDFVADLQHVLADEPADAFVESWTIRLKRWTRKHPGTVSALAASLLVGIFGLMSGLYFVNAEKNEKEWARAAEATQRGIAETNLAYARKGNELLTSVFQNLDPGAPYATVSELRTAMQSQLTKAVSELEGATIGDPLTVAQMQIWLGLSLINLGDSKSAVTLFQQSFDTRRDKLGPDHPDTLMSMNNLAGGYDAAGQIERAMPLYDEVLKRRKAVLGPDHRDTLMSMNNLAGGYNSTGQVERAMPLFEETLKRRKAVLGPDDPDTLMSMNNLAGGYQSLGRLEQALPLYEETVALMKTNLGSDHPTTLTTMNNLADCYDAAGQLERALRLHEETLKLRKVKLGSDHPGTLTSMNNLASCYESAGQLERALPLYEETMVLMKVKLGRDHPDTLTSMNNLALGYKFAGQLDRALPLLEETLKSRKVKLGPDHPGTLASMNNLADGYETAGQLDRALPLYEQAARGIESRNYWNEYVRSIVRNAAKAYEDANQLQAAEGWWRKWLAAEKKKSGAESPDHAGALADLGLNLVSQAKWPEAETVLRECLAIRLAKQPAEWGTWNTQSLLGQALEQQGKLDEAGPLVVKGYEGLKEREAKIPEKVRSKILRNAALRVALFHEKSGDAAAAKEWRDRAGPEPKKPQVPNVSPRTFDSVMTEIEKKFAR